MTNKKGIAMKLSTSLITTTILALSLAPTPTVLAASVSVIYAWPNLSHNSAGVPEHSLIMDSSGALYGSYVGGSMKSDATGMIVKGATIFKLTPPVPGETASTESDLFTFNGDNGDAPGDLIMDKSGAIYGTTFDGGASTSGPCGSYGCGVAFKLTPPTTGQAAWTETVLYDFKGMNDGSNPDGGLTLDSSGNLYGTASASGGNGFGTVFKLSPPEAGATNWNINILRNFESGNDGARPLGSLVLDAQGALYGTTSHGGGGVSNGGDACANVGCGVVYKLAAGQTGWKESILARFNGVGGKRFPVAGLVFDATGALYGTTEDIGIGSTGTAFQLVPPTPSHVAWTLNVIHQFGSSGLGRNPQSGVAFDTAGAIYGSTQGGGRDGAGVVYKLSPPTASHPAWLQTLLYAPETIGSNNYFANGVLVGPDGAVYGASQDGGYGQGYVFKITQ